MRFRRFLLQHVRASRPDESGFTLAELIIAIAIETIVFGALATAFVVVLNGGTSVNDNLNRSSDARLAAAYIVSDARNSSGPEISLTDSTTCPDPSPPVVGTPTPIARFGWVTPNLGGTTTPNVSNYVLVSGSILRRHCEAGVLVSDAALARDVAGVTVSCSPVSDCSGAPTSITVTITATAGTQESAGSSPYTYSLTATFRKLIGGGSPLTPSPPQSLVVFGSGGCGVNISGAGVMKVYGNAFINTADTAGCKALTLGNSGVFNAGGTSILAGGSCVASGGSVCPTVTSYSPAITDPYSGLVPPTTTGRPAQTGCSGPQASQTAQPGVYAGVFSIGGGNTCTLASGIYILKGGFDIGNGAVVKTGAGGVLFYITGGAFVVGGGAALTLTAMTTGAYTGIAVWQAAADTSTIVLANGGAIIFNGTLYAPKAELNISGNAQTPVAWSIVVQTVVITNSGGIKIGASPVPLSITAPAALAPWTVNRAYPSTTLTPSGGDGSYSWSATGLPAGVTINTTTGIISGTPTAVGVASVVVTLNDALGDDASTRTYTLAVNAAPSITTASPLPAGNQGAPYSTTLASTGGTAPVAWSASGLPAGLSIDGGTGVISGTPTGSGTTATVTLTDAAGATATKSFAIAVNVVAQPTIVSVALNNVNGGTAGRVEKGDSITIVFSAAMDASTLCSAWVSNTTNYTLSANNNVTVNLNDGTGATHDTMSVASATCTFNFGLLDLGVSTYVSGGSAVFKGTSSSASKITWTYSTRTLVITLGSKGSAGTVATVATSTPIYTASPAVRDALGGALGNSPFTLAAGRQF